MLLLLLRVDAGTSCGCEKSLVAADACRAEVEGSPREDEVDDLDVTPSAQTIADYRQALCARRDGRFAAL